MKTLLALAFLVLAGAAQAQANVDSSGLALQGYDPVAYFTEQKAIRGRPQFSAQHEGATYRFFSQANRDAFVAAPQKYAPQYGGYCAFGMASGYKAPIDPDAFSVVGDKLYLNYSKSVRKQWSSDVPGHIGKADAHWPVIQKKP